MRIKSIRLRNFMKHRDSILHLPETGITILLGPNGAGKSAFIEGTRTALWDETFRKKPGWHKKELSIVDVVTYDGLHVSRSNTGTRKKLVFTHASIPTGTKYENNTKAQRALETIIGDGDVWAKTKVFSSSDASSFSTASDADRKRLIESITGHTKFDPALEKAKKDLKSVSRQLNDTKHKIHLLQESIESEIRHKKELIDNDKKLKPVKHSVVDIDSALEQLTKEVEEIEDKVQSLRSRADDKRSKQLKILGKVDTVKERLSIADLDVCSECGQEVAQEHKDKISKKATRELKELNTEITRLDEEIRKPSSLAAKHEERLRDLRRKQRALQSEMQDAINYNKFRTTYNKTIKSLDSRIEDSREELAEIKKKADELESEEAVLIPTVEVLGITGVRSALLANSLTSIEQITNPWLAKLPVEEGVISIKLTSYTEKASGELKEAISVSVLGAGGEGGFRGASAGERRRIDLALVLSLGEVAAEAWGVAAGTVFFDEIFDALDAECVDAVCEILLEMAKHKSIVLITHSEKIYKKLKADSKIVRVSKGTIQ